MKKIFLGCMLSVYSLSCATMNQEIGTVNTDDNSNINQTINYYNKDSYTHIINFAIGLSIGSYFSIVFSPRQMTVVINKISYRSRYFFIPIFLGGSLFSNNFSKDDFSINDNWFSMPKINQSQNKYDYIDVVPKEKQDEFYEQTAHQNHETQDVLEDRNDNVTLDIGIEHPNSKPRAALANRNDIKYLIDDMIKDLESNNTATELLKKYPKLLHGNDNQNLQDGIIQSEERHEIKYKKTLGIKNNFLRRVYNFRIGQFLRGVGNFRRDKSVLFLGNKVRTVNVNEFNNFSNRSELNHIDISNAISNYPVNQILNRRTTELLN